MSRWKVGKQWLAGRIGRASTIQFRREMLGVAEDILITLAATEYNDADLKIKGTLAALDGHYLILRHNRALVWVGESSNFAVRSDE